LITMVSRAVDAELYDCYRLATKWSINSHILLTLISLFYGWIDRFLKLKNHWNNFTK